MNVNLYIIEDYREKDDFAVQKNKPKTNPISNGASTHGQEEVQIIVDLAVGGR